MKNLEEKLEKFVNGYVKNLEEKPVATIVKTLIVIWVVTKVIKMIKK